MEKISDIEAINSLLGLPVNIKTELLPLNECPGRILSEDIFAKIDVPPFDKSPFDGYAMRGEDIKEADKSPVTLSITEDIPAGGYPTIPLGPGLAAKVSTGACLPQGADCVEKYENTEFTKDSVTISSPLTPGKTVVKKGEDAKAGQLLFNKGSIIGSAITGGLASQGIDRVDVYKIPKVSVISTGSELCQAGAPLIKGKIYNSNSHTICAYLREMGYDSTDLGIIPDERDSICGAIKNALFSSDMVITTGGASVGDYDWAHRCAESLGAEILFSGIKLKPGGACVGSHINGKVILSLSGNPWAAMCGLIRVGIPYLRKLSGRGDYHFSSHLFTLEEDFNKPTGFVRLLPGKTVIKEGRIFFRQMNSFKNSQIIPFMECNSLAVIPKEKLPLKAGDLVEGFFIHEK